MVAAWQDAVWIDTQGAVALSGSHIVDVGRASALKANYPSADSHIYGQDHLICPGFVDAHVHYPQTRIIASWGKRLIDWLNTYTFPEEMRLADPNYARHVAACYLDVTLFNGTTTVASYATIHPHSVEVFFDLAQRRKQRVVAGKTCMDRNAPDALRDTPKSAYDESKRLIDEWHGRDRITYAITPRFAPTSSADQLNALGALWAEHPSCLMQTHLSEQPDEIDWVAQLYPDQRDYLDVYEAHGLLGDRAVFGHAIHLNPREMDRLAEVGSALVHCPTSNLFIGSGLFDLDTCAKRNIPLGLATDTGGGSSFSMLRTMATAYEVAQLRQTTLHAGQLIWLATAGSARSLHLHNHIGTLDRGYEADFTILTLNASSALAKRFAYAEDIWDALFATIMMGDDRAIAEVWIAGKRQKHRAFVSTKDFFDYSFSSLT